MKASVDFNYSFMAARMVETFEKLSDNVTAGHTDAVNYEAMSPKAKMLWAQATLQRLDAIAKDAAARRAELVELMEEQAAEGDE